MTKKEPGYYNEYSKTYYRIRDVAEFVGVPMSTLRYWEKEFPESVTPMRNSGMTRYYTPQQIETLKLIKYLVHDRGMKIEAAREELRGNPKNVTKRVKIMDLLTEIKEDLGQIKSALDRRK